MNAQELQADNKSSKQRSRGWCFTENLAELKDGAEFGDEQATEFAKRFDWDEEHPVDFTADVLVFQLERGDQGTYHLQGWVEFKNPRKLGGLKRILPRAHWEPRRGSKKQALAYVRKEETRVSGPWYYPVGVNVDHWTRASQGTRTDLEELFCLARSGAPAVALADARPGSFVRFHKHIQSALHMVRRNRIRPTLKILLIKGDTGLGKSHWIWNAIDGAGLMDDVYRKSAGKWWDGYMNQKLIVFDDFNYDVVNAKDIIQWWDKWPVDVNVKNTMVKLDFEYVIILDNREPDEWWSPKKDGEPKVHPKVMDAVKRRITDRVTFHEYGTPTLDTNRSEFNHRWGWLLKDFMLERQLALGAAELEELLDE